MKNASSCARIARPTSIARPVVSTISDVIATNRNQSPPNEITEARNSLRKSRLRCNREMLARSPVVASSSWSIGSDSRSAISVRQTTTGRREGMMSWSST